MARDIFEIAKAFQDKIENDTNYMFRFGENFRNDFMGNFEMPERMSRSRYNDLNYQYQRDDLSQNYQTNLETSRNNADIARDTSIYNRDRLPQTFELQDRQRDLNLITTENSIEEQRNNQLFNQFKQEVGAQAPIDAGGMANYFTTLYSRNDQAGGNANIAARINEEYRAAVGPMIQSLESIDSQIQQLQVAEALMLDPQQLAASGYTAEQVQQRILRIKSAIVMGVNRIARYKDVLELGEMRGLVRPDLLNYLDPNYIASVSSGSILPTGVTPDQAAAESTPVPQGATDIASSVAMPSPATGIPGEVTPPPAPAPAPPVVQTANAADQAPQPQAGSSEPVTVPDEVWQRLTELAPNLSYEELSAAGIVPATVGLQPQTSTEQTAQPQAQTAKAVVDTAIQSNIPVVQGAETAAEEVDTIFSQIGVSEQDRPLFAEALMFETQDGETMQTYATRLNNLLANHREQLEGIVIDPETNATAYDLVEYRKTELESLNAAREAEAQRLELATIKNEMERIIPQGIISLIEEEPDNEQERIELIQDLNFVKTQLQEGLRNPQNMANWHRGITFQIDVAGDVIEMNPADFQGIDKPGLALVTFTDAIDGRLLELSQEE